ncbi:MAG TPA: protein-L-isoaspartate(D-aspartate) O-methyltransferase [Terriglobia bacterium]|nr:protein-L-isoaspartate(D-aspartate) O-methyltransferase [Terriglobia bacterium]
MNARRSSPPQSLAWFLMIFVLFPHTLPSPPEGKSEAGDERSRADPAELPETREARERMVEEQIIARGIRDPRVLEALRKVPRHRFVPPEMQPSAYEDRALPIGLGQTISQPYVVAFMTEALELQPQDRVLEIGTGSGYQAAVLSLLVREVYSMEIVEPLGKAAEARLKEMGYANVRVRIGDGYRGWPEAAPFDAIIVTAAPPDVPPALVAQLRPGGRMVVPVGRYVQNLIRLRRTAKGLERESLLPVRFVPMVPETERAPK